MVSFLVQRYQIQSSLLYVAVQRTRRVSNDKQVKSMNGSFHFLSLALYLQLASYKPVGERIAVFLYKL